MIDKKVRISEAAKILGISPQTLRNWEGLGRIRSERSPGKQRYYLLADLKKFTIDIKMLGMVWATSAIPPELPSEYYCERSDRFTSRVERMATELIHIGLSEDIASLVTLIAGEIGDNSFAHNVANWPDVPGIFFAYDLDKKVIVVADRGRGVKATLQPVKPEINDDFDALHVAFTEVISARNPEKRGNGLKVCRSALESSEIGLSYRSGIGLVTIPKEKPGSLTITMSDQNVRGTYCVITF